MNSRRILRAILVVLALISVIMTGIIGYVMSSEYASPKVIAFALGKSTKDLKIGTVRGRLRGPLIFHDVRYRAGALEVEIDSAWIEWRPFQLARGQVAVTRFYARGVRIDRQSQSERDTVVVDGKDTIVKTDEHERRPVRFTLQVDTSIWHDVVITGPRGTRLRSSELVATGSPSEFRFRMRGSGQVAEQPIDSFDAIGIGHENSIELSQGVVRAAGGVLQVAGTISWEDDPAWDLLFDGVDLDARRFDSTNQFRLPDDLDVHGRIVGAMRDAGATGTITLDSLKGIYRARPVLATGRFDHQGRVVSDFDLDVRWGSNTLVANGRVDETVAVDYRLGLRDLDAVMDGAKGTLDVVGTARGPRSKARIEGRIMGSGVRYGGTQLGNVNGRADLTLGSVRGSVALASNNGRIGQRTLDRVALTATGDLTDFVARLNAASESDHGGIRVVVQRRNDDWRAVVDSFQMRVAGSRFELARPSTLTMNRSAWSLSELCVRDSLQGSACAQGQWHRSGAWSGRMAVDHFSLTPFLPRIGDTAAGQGIERGIVSGWLEGRGTRGSSEITLVARGDSIPTASLKSDDRPSPMLFLDSLLVTVRRSGRQATLAGNGRARNEKGDELGRLQLDLRSDGFMGLSRLASTPIDGRLTADLGDLATLKPIVRVDTLRGTSHLDVQMSGTAGDPKITGALEIRGFSYGNVDGRLVGDSVAIAGSLGRLPDGHLGADIRMRPGGLRYDYTRFAGNKSLLIDTAGITIHRDARALTVALGALARQDSAIGSLFAKADLPGYRGITRVTAAQPITFELDGSASDLSILEVMARGLDTLHGQLALRIEGRGPIGSPAMTGSVDVKDMVVVLPIGTTIRGGISGTASSGSSSGRFGGRMRIEPRGLTVTYREGAKPVNLSIEDSYLSAEIGPNGLESSLVSRLLDSTRNPLIHLKADFRLPDMVQFKLPKTSDRFELAAEGEAADLAFLGALSSRYDSVAGRLSLNVTGTGTMQDTRIKGRVELAGGAVRMPIFGIVLRDINVLAQSDSAGGIGVDGAMRSGNGSLTFTGKAVTYPDIRGKFQVTGDNFEIANNAEVRAIVSPRVEVLTIGDSLSISGEVLVPVAVVTLSDLPATVIKSSGDVFLIDTVGVRRTSRPITTRVRVTLGEEVRFEGFDFEAKLGGSIEVTDRPAGLATAVGTIEVESGRYRAYGQNLRIESGVVRFYGGPLSNPGLALRATRLGHDSTLVGFLIRGTLKEPEVALFSDRALSESQILSYLVTGGPVEEVTSGTLLNRALTSLGLRAGSRVTGVLGQKIGLSQAKFKTASDVRNVALVAGRYLSPNLFVSYGIGIFDPVGTFRIQYVLSDRVSLVAERGTQTSADIKIAPKK